ncbi:unnamed protein product (macronuclear) [Paramecium tetraurelia]|uniref:Tubulin-tyrosine ligase family protein n=1 Tax=Paramecium tetraurelia TaxID=5888 RepID=A0CKF7_PARTE|nr:uncharacterized protein GSPATT00000988001 [Paramecium tetraurelia]CAK71274.1 unnamed protein product [Paramecium tetraurelia]|eukprot:XP_001438671.1 hypothetical protein (macronuclear) [Paramecium tetraurelia strain d4-2]
MNREDLAIFPHTPQFQTIYNPTLVHPMSAFVSRSSYKNNQLQRNKLNRFNVEQYYSKRQHDQRHISLPRALQAVKKQQNEQQRRGSHYKEATISIVYPDSKNEDSIVSKIDKLSNLQNNLQGVHMDLVEEKKTNIIDLKKSYTRFKETSKTKTLLSTILRGFQCKQNDFDNDNLIQIMGLQIKASKQQEQQAFRTKAYSLEKERESIKTSIEKRETTTRSVQKRRESPQSKIKNVSQSNMKINQNFRFSLNEYSNLSRDQLFQTKLFSYHHFLFMVSAQSNFYVVPSNNLIELKFKVGKGNNSLLIKETFKQRWWWTLNQEADNKELNFIWTQIKVPQFMNLQEWSKESVLTRQKSLSTTSTELKRMKKPQSPKSLKKSTRFGKFDDPLQKLMNDQDICELKNIDKSIQDFQKYAEKKEFKIIDNFHKIHNHIERNYHLGNKKAMFHNMKKFYELTKQDLFQHLPVTFHVSGVKDKSYLQFLEYYKEKKGNGIWIVKPGEFTNRGNGIIVCQNLNEIHRIVSKRQNHPNGKPFTYLIQKYIEKPFLYNKRKFDIRCYFLITQLNNVIRAYWYEEGYLRTSSEEFDIKDVSNQYVHLTNDAIQKYSEAYGKYENGNKLSFAEFQRYLDKWHNNDHFDFYKDLYPQLKVITLNAIKSVYHKIEPFKKNYNFEIFGLDFMIDEKFKPYLIEINTNPCLELSSPLLGRIIPAMVENAFRLSIDTLVPPPESSAWPPNKKHLLFYDNLLENNRFQLLFDEKDDALDLKNLYSNQINDDQIDEMNEEEEEYKSDDD